MCNDRGWIVAQEDRMAEQQNMRVEPIGGHIGALVSGVDLGLPTNEKTFRGIHEALMELLLRRSVRLWRLGDAV